MRCQLALKVLEQARARLGDPGPKPCEVSAPLPCPEPRWSPVSLQPSLRPALHRRAAVPARLRPQTPSSWCWLCVLRATGCLERASGQQPQTCGFPFPFCCPSLTTHRRHSLTKTEFAPVKINGRFTIDVSKPSTAALPFLGLERCELMAHVTNNSFKRTVSCKGVRCSKIISKRKTQQLTQCCFWTFYNLLLQQ